MGTGAQNLGRTGLAHNVNKRESARQDLAVMGQMVDQKKALEQEEQQAALIEQKYYEQIRAEADKMLAGDKVKIHAKSKDFQAQIRSQIKANGGSRSKFMANGGIGLLGDYSKNILESREVAQYKQNKVNLEQLLDIKKKGLGHLLSDRDNLSLQEYNTHGTGNISYSGLKNEIEIPPSDSFMFGTYATPGEMLKHGDNYMKIMGNYKIDNPDIDIETEPYPMQYERLHMYTREQGWTQRGSKMDPNAYRRNQSKGRSDGRAVDKDGRPIITKSGDMTTHYKVYNKLIGLDEMNKGNLLKDDYIKDVYGDTSYTKKTTIDPSIGSKIQEFAGYATGIGGLFMSTELWNFEHDNAFAARGALDLGRNMDVPLWKTANGDTHKVVDGVVSNVNPNDLGDVYLANGAPVKEKDKMEKGDYRITGSFMGYEFLSQGESYMVVDAYDNDGKLNQDRTDSLYDTKGEAQLPTGKQAMFISLEDSKGNVYSQKVPYGALGQESALADALLGANDLSDQVIEREAKQAHLNKIKGEIAVSKEGKAALEMPIEVHNMFDKSISFQEALGKYNSYNKNGNMRGSIMKAFYMTQFDNMTSNPETAPGADMQASIKNNDFATLLVQELGLGNKLQDPSYTDKDFMDEIESILTSKEYNIATETQTSEEMLRSNRIFVQKMKNYLQKANRVSDTNTPPKAEDGANFGFTAGSEWGIEKDFKGPSHAKGGINVNPKNI